MRCLLVAVCALGIVLVVPPAPARAESVARPDPCALAEVRADGLTVSVTDLGLDIGVGGERQFDVVWDWGRAETMSSTEAVVEAGLQDTVPPRGSVSHTYPAAGTYTLELAIATGDDRCQTFDIDAPTPPTGLLYEVTVPPSDKGPGGSTKATVAAGGPVAEEEVSTGSGQEEVPEDCGLSLPGEYRKGASPEVASLILDFVPLIGTVKGVVEAIGGCDMVTGQKFSDEEKAWNILFALLSIIPLGAVLKVLSRSPKYMKYLEWLPKILKSPEMVERVRELGESAAGFKFKNKPRPFDATATKTAKAKASPGAKVRVFDYEVPGGDDAEARAFFKHLTGHDPADLPVEDIGKGGGVRISTPDGRTVIYRSPEGHDLGHAKVEVDYQESKAATGQSTRAKYTFPGGG